MGLKPSVATSLRHVRRRLKSDQCGIETSQAGLAYAGRRGSNRTNVGLKPSAARTILSWTHWLKSDQCGIETHGYASIELQAAAELKSDQCGIETCSDDAASFAYAAGSNRTNVGLKPMRRLALSRRVQWLKSDQCGIETARVIARHADCARLKSDQCGIETVLRSSDA